MTRQSKTTSPLLCPSARCSQGVLLVGIIAADGTVGYMNPAPKISAEFTNKAGESGAPERRFRFGAPCQESRCCHWTGSRCAVIDGAKLVAESLPQGERILPKCAVRRECRWFAQMGTDACFLCPSLFNYLESDSSRSKGDTNEY